MGGRPGLQPERPWATAECPRPSHLKALGQEEARTNPAALTPRDSPDRRVRASSAQLVLRALGWGVGGGAQVQAGSGSLCGRCGAGWPPICLARSLGPVPLVAHGLRPQKLTVLGGVASTQHHQCHPAQFHSGTPGLEGLRSHPAPRESHTGGCYGEVHPSVTRSKAQRIVNLLRAGLCAGP